MLKKVKTQNKSSKLLMAAATLTPAFATAVPQVINSPIVQNIVANADETTTTEAHNQADGISKDGKVKDVTTDTHVKDSANINDNGVGEGATSQSDRYSPVNTENSLTGNTTGNTDSESASSSSNNTSSASSQSNSSSTSSASDNTNTSSESNSPSSNASDTAKNTTTSQNSSNSDTQSDVKQVVNYINQHADPKIDMDENATLANIPANTNVQDYAKDHGFTKATKIQSGEHTLNIYYNPSTKEFMVSEDNNNKPLSLSDIMGVLNLKHNENGVTNGTSASNANNGVNTPTSVPGGVSGAFGASAGNLAQTNTNSNKNTIALSALGLTSIGLIIGLSGDKLKLKK